MGDWNFNSFKSNPDCGKTKGKVPFLEITNLFDYSLTLNTKISDVLVNPHTTYL